VLTVAPPPAAGSPFFSRQERFPLVDSTNDVVRDWLADGTPEVCLAVADEQAAGRGRVGRSWIAPAGAALLCSLGFRPDWLPAEQTWRLAAIVALAMADAAEEVAGLRDRAIRLKWPNDLVIEDGGPADARAGTLRKVAGVLGETDGLGTDDPRVVVGIGINAGWAPTEFPPTLAAGMTSLHEASGGRPVDLGWLLDGFTARVEPRLVALRTGRFDLGDWTDRQVTTGREVRIETADGAIALVHALGVDGRSGALVVADATAPGGERSIHSGEIVHVRVTAPGTGTDADSTAGV
jgi:BirA family biotin operon repressor/biotin-[acetyl-CoA-carboxylase] ligase